MADVFFVRHGETDWNEDDKLRGWAPIPLNHDGLQEAKQAAQALKDQKVTHIVAADLPRVIQTAEAIHKATKAPVTLDRRLRDFDYGDWTGRPVKGVLNRMIKIFRNEEGTPPGGEEDYHDTLARVHRAFDSLLTTAEQVHQGSYVIVSSNRIARMLMSYLDDDQKWTLQKEDPLGNGGILKLTQRGKDWTWKIWHGASGKQFGFKEE